MKRSRPPTTEEINRGYCATLQRELAKEGTATCIDCKPWGQTPDVIELCPRHAAVEDLLRATVWMTGELERAEHSLTVKAEFKRALRALQAIARTKAARP